VFTQIGTGAYASCGRRANGTVACWGNSANGISQPPAGMGFTTLSVGHYHACGLREDRSSVCWGYDAGQGAGSLPNP
jgi:hypothetical protein